jgi:hypothetical protein
LVVQVGGSAHARVRSLSSDAAGLEVPRFGGWDVVGCKGEGNLGQWSPGWCTNHGFWNVVYWHLLVRTSADDDEMVHGMGAP